MGVSSGNKAFSIIALLVSTSHLRLNWCGMDALTDDTLKCLKHCAKRCAGNTCVKNSSPILKVLTILSTLVVLINSLRLTRDAC